MLNKAREKLNKKSVRESWQQLTLAEQLNVNETERLISLLGGLGLALYGLIRRGPLGLALLVGSSVLIYRGLTGHCPAYEAAGIDSLSRVERLHREARKKAKSAAEKDIVDRAISGSFPASDPPAWTA